MKKSRIIGLDLIRAVSAILIVLYHYTTRYSEIVQTETAYPIRMQWASCAVATFFILSGFFSIHGSNGSGFQYLLSRAKRLYPAYIPCVVLTFLTCVFFLPEKANSISTFLINFSMLQGFIGVPNIDGAYWTLTVEIVFYISIALLIQLRQIKKIHIIQLPWIILLYLSAILLKADIITGVAGTLVRLLLNVEYGHLFLIGIAIADIDLNGKRRPLSYITLALCLGYTAIFQSMVYTIFVSLSSLLIFACTMPTIRKISFGRIGRAGLFIAGISYPLYLLHQFIGYAILHQLEINFGLTSEFFIIIPIGISIGVASAIHYGVEIPINNFFKQRKAIKKNTN